MGLFKLKNLLLVLTFGVLIYFSCSEKQVEQTEEVILAKVGNKSISVNEFIRRSEYTIRPDYCKGDNYIHRKIILNSLIAEKMYALEAGEDNELTRNDEFRLYLQGRKEQAMRQWLYKKLAVEKVELDSSDLKKAYSQAGKTYNISYFTLSDELSAAAAEAALNQEGATFEKVFRDISGETEIPDREIGWQYPEEMAVHNALFSGNVKKGDVLGPFKIDKSSFLFMRVNGWKNKVAITDQQVHKRWQITREVLTDRKAISVYQDYVKELMKGKKIEFNPDTFLKLVKIKGPQYFKTEDQKEEQFHRRFWNKDAKDEMVSGAPDVQLSEIINEPLFTIDGQVWTVGDLEIALIRHPLVFRKRKFSSSQFGEQLKLAIVDLIRDEYITEEAYKRNYDQVNVVRRNYNMWRDNLLALYHKKNLLDSEKNVNTEQKDLMKSLFNPLFVDLKKKYDSEVMINTDAFEDIELTNIDMFVIQKNMAFPVVVPSFPQITTEHALDYGRKLN